jgi:16S rRNA (guanine966-N2)-methyltransferase
MRIIAGKFRGRGIASPADTTVRPTSDKVRGAIFNILSHGEWPHDLFSEDTRVVDAFCGSGALGLEALSRGAGFALFLDNNTASLRLAKENTEKFGIQKNCRFEMRELAAVHSWREKPFQLLFLDPPYRKNLPLPALEILMKGGFVAKGAVAVLEHAKAEQLPAPEGWTLHTRRAWGNTAATFLIYE